MEKYFLIKKIGSDKFTKIDLNNLDILNNIPNNIEEILIVAKGN